MSRLQDLRGKRFGRLIPLGCTVKNKIAYWLCQCDCGNETTVVAGSLRKGCTKSCGCLLKENGKNLKENSYQKTHGMSHTREFEAWLRMFARCENPNEGQYPNYGGRGIKVSEEWRGNFQAFYDHIGPRPSNKHSVDRIDVNGNYEPGNVRWATAKEQRANQRIPTKCRKGHDLTECGVTVMYGYRRCNNCLRLEKEPRTVF